MFYDSETFIYYNSIHLYYMVKKYVFDASTAILLAKVTLLRTIAGHWKIIITPAVKKEIFKKNFSEDSQIVEALIREKLISEFDSADSAIFAEKFGLGIGEAEAIRFSSKEGYILATDDGKAIKTAKILGVGFVTAIHCLLYLHKNKKIDSKIALEKLKNLEKYGRYNAVIMRDATKIIKGVQNDE